MRYNPQTRDFEARRALQGKSHRDIRRCLTRSIAGRLYPNHGVLSWRPPDPHSHLTNMGASNRLLRQLLRQ